MEQMGLQVIVMRIIQTGPLQRSASNHVDMTSKVILINKPTGVKEFL